MEIQPSQEAPAERSQEQQLVPANQETSPASATARPPEQEKKSRAELAAVEREIDQLRQELFLAWEAYQRREAAEREQWARESEIRDEGLIASLRRLFGRKRPPVGGRLTLEESTEISRGKDEINNRLHQLFRERDRLEEELLDLETLRERRKTRWSKEYIDALQEAGRALTGEEQYQLGKGERWHALYVDEEIKRLQAKREGREVPENPYR